MLPMVVTAWNREDAKRKSQHKINNKVLKIKTYRLSQLVEVLIVDEHTVFRHTLQGLLIHVARERDRILLNMSRQRHLEKSKVEVALVWDRRFSFIKGAPMINDPPGAL